MFLKISARSPFLGLRLYEFVLNSLDYTGSSYFLAGVFVSLSYPVRLHNLIANC